MGIKYQVNKDFFKRWSPEMAYVLGYLYADGSMEDASYIRGKYVRVSGVEKTNITNIKRLLDSKHTLYEEKRPGKRKKSYLLRIGDHTLYEDLLKLGLFPNKSKTIRFPVVPEQFLSFFVLGYFDGDGCVMINREKNKKKKFIIKRLRVVFTCGSKPFLTSLAKSLHKCLNTNQTNVYNGHRSYALCYSTNDSARIFDFFYNQKKFKLFSKRKFNIFCKYFELKPHKANRRTRSTIKCHKPGRVVK